MADDLAEQGKPHYIEIQGAQYEGYTVWFNTLVNSAGGQIMSDNGSKVTLNSPRSRRSTTIHELAPRRPPIPRSETRWRTRRGSSSRRAARRSS